jgi:hypothetical protein
MTKRSADTFDLTMRSPRVSTDVDVSAHPWRSHSEIKRGSIVLKLAAKPLQSPTPRVSIEICLADRLQFDGRNANSQIKETFHQRRVDLLKNGLYRLVDDKDP